MRLRRAALLRGRRDRAEPRARPAAATRVGSALYLTAVVLLLFEAAVILVMLVYTQGRTATA